jgi:hypothetical protein
MDAVNRRSPQQVAGCSGDDVAEVTATSISVAQSASPNQKY